MDCVVTAYKESGEFYVHFGPIPESQLEEFSERLYASGYTEVYGYPLNPLPIEDFGDTLVAEPVWEPIYSEEV